MSKGFIVVGDRTSHGGVVTTGSPHSDFEGRAVARLGDLVDCPLRYPGGAPHGINQIVEGDAGCEIDGLPVALDGHRTVCGCSLISASSSSVG